MSVVPVGWAVAPLGELVSVGSGGTPKRSDPSFFGGRIPWVTISDLNDGVVAGTREHLTESGLASCSAKLVPAEAVLIALYGSIGKLGRAGVPLATNQAIAVAYPDTSAYDSRYLFHYLASRVAELNGLGSGVTQKNIYLGDIKAFGVKIAPRCEQSRIVEKLEELLSHLDAGVAELRAAQAKLKLYRQSLLKAAVTGDLTVEWRERMAAGEASNLHGPDGDELPAGWTQVRVGDLARVGTGVTPLRSRADYFEGGTFPWVTSGALNVNVVLGASELLTPVALSECRLQIFPPGTLLVAMYGEGKTRGKCSELGFASTINQAIAAIVLHPESVGNKRFLKIFLLYSYAKMREQASGGVQPNLNLQIIKNIEVPLPPPDEQRVVVEVLDGLLENIAEQTTAITHALRQSEAQRKNILQAAFSGQLVPQDPSDEPASVLLQRIRASRAGKATAPTRRPRKAREPA